MPVPPSYSLRAAFLQFREECIWIMRLYNMFAYLWEDDEGIDRVMRLSAPAFFADLNRILPEYIYQRVCLITDPPVTTVRKVLRENLSCLLLNQKLDAISLMSPAIQTHTSAMLRYRDLVKPARDRAISHLDMEFVMGAGDLGAHAEAEVGKFLTAMQGYCDEVGKALGEGPLNFFCTAQDGDVMDLIDCLSLGLNARESKS